MGPANVYALATMSVDSPVMAIKASEQRYAEYVGANGVKARNMLHNILADVKPELLFAAFDSLGRGIGERKSRALLEVISLEDFLAGNVSVSQITAIHGFEVKTAQLIVDNLPVALEQYRAVQDLVTFKQKESVAAVAGKLSGQVLCATGVRIKDDILAKVLSQGGVVVDSFTAAVTILVAKDKNSNSSKIEKARSRGVKIVDLQELESLL
jgi:NAD-dependent DNA ligase